MIAVRRREIQKARSSSALETLLPWVAQMSRDHCQRRKYLSKLRWRFAAMCLIFLAIRWRCLASSVGSLFSNDSSTLLQWLSRRISSVKRRSRSLISQSALLSFFTKRLTSLAKLQAAETPPKMARPSTIMLSSDTYSCSPEKPVPSHRHSRTCFQRCDG